jgi:hypothetical protein
MDLDLKSRLNPAMASHQNCQQLKISREITQAVDMHLQLQRHTPCYASLMFDADTARLRYYSSMIKRMYLLPLSSLETFVAAVYLSPSPSPRRVINNIIVDRIPTFQLKQAYNSKTRK